MKQGPASDVAVSGGREVSLGGQRVRRDRAVSEHRSTFREGLEKDRPHLIAGAKYLYGRIDANRSLGLAAEMAFWLFLSLMPLAALGGLLAARFAIHDSAVTASLVESLPAAARDMVSDELGRVAAWNGGKVGVIAGVMFVWLGSSGIHAVFDGIELESEAAPRPWWKKRLVALATCLALAVGAGLVSLLGAGLEASSKLLGDAHQHGFMDSTAGHWIGRVLATLLAFAMITGLFWVSVPPHTRKTMPLWPGAATAVILQGVIGVTYGFYIQKIGDGGAYQAGLAAIGITLMALYLFCLALLVGIEVNQVLGERHRAALERRRDDLRSAPASG